MPAHPARAQMELIAHKTQETETICTSYIIHYLLYLGANKITNNLVFQLHPCRFKVFRCPGEQVVTVTVTVVGWDEKVKKACLLRIHGSSKNNHICDAFTNLGDERPVLLIHEHVILLALLLC